MKRIYETLLNEYLTYFPCVALIGPRQCGKTTLLQTLPKLWKRIDLEKQSDHQLLAEYKTYGNISVVPYKQGFFCTKSGI